MQTSIHGIEHVQRRTNMTLKDMHAILGRGIFISLGTNPARESEFLLFYSPPDRECKIAVVSLDRKTLISIWDWNYKLPQGIDRVTRARRRRAKDLVRQDILKRASQAARTESYDCELRVDIRAGKMIHYVYGGVLGEIPPETIRSQSALVRFGDQLTSIMRDAEHKQKSTEGREPVYYFTIRRRDTGKEVRRWSYKHSSLQKLLATGAG